MRMLLMAGAGGAVGSMARYLVGVLSARLFGIAFPWGTFIVNVAGCFLMGLLIEAVALRFSISTELRTFLAVGVLGGFTTFSSFALDFASLLEKKQNFAALTYLGGSVLLSLVALFLGLQLARALFAQPF
jgi:CrcB protein